MLTGDFWHKSYDEVDLLSLERRLIDEVDLEITVRTCRSFVTHQSDSNFEEFVLLRLIQKYFCENYPFLLNKCILKTTNICREASLSHFLIESLKLLIISFRIV